MCTQSKGRPHGEVIIQWRLWVPNTASPDSTLKLFRHHLSTMSVRVTQTTYTKFTPGGRVDHVEIRSCTNCLQIDSSACSNCQSQFCATSDDTIINKHVQYKQHFNPTQELCPSVLKQILQHSKGTFQSLPGWKWLECHFSFSGSAKRWLRLFTRSTAWEWRSYDCMHVREESGSKTYSRS